MLPYPELVPSALRFTGVMCLPSSPTNLGKSSHPIDYCISAALTAPSLSRDKLLMIRMQLALPAMSLARLEAVYCFYTPSRKPTPPTT